LLAGCSESHSSRRAFEACVGTLTRTKESISRATRLALDCAKHGIAGEVRPCKLFTLILEACCFTVVYLRLISHGFIITVNLLIFFPCFSSLLGFICSLPQLAWDKRLCCCCCCCCCCNLLIFVHLVA
jgi:hypothetical protein